MDFYEVNGKRESESEAQYLAFCRYRDDREKRNVSAVARELGIGKTTLFRWKQEHDWDARCAVIDATVNGYIMDQNFEKEFQENMVKISNITDLLLAELEGYISDGEKKTIKDLYQMTRAMCAVLEIKANTSWYGPVIEALKALHKTEIAEQASEAFFDKRLPKLSQRTRDPEDTA